jgi:16S rRNA A1518/A1519 N6-dimethyltransferase RsmA/KsgA/DIM1 with predicted DNA glycosylase/AP lyase activity
MGLDKATVADRLTRAGVNPGKRAEELALEEFAAIAEAFAVHSS